MKHPSLIALLLVLTLFGAVTIVQAQGQEPQTQPAPQQVWSPEQLDNLVAPIALYPDPLLGQMLVASTYPLEVVEANQWLQRNRNLSGQALVNAAKQQPWDPSIQALVAVPDALAKLNQDIRWTTDLGNAFLGQQADVMNAVQQLRARAQEDGHLASTPQQTVTTEDQGGQQAIVIEPANPQVIYVPAYDPYYIWGPPVYGFYPPLYYPGFGFFFGPGFDLGFCFAGWGGWGGWGWGPSWFGGSVFVNNGFFNRYGFHNGGGFGRTPWVHNPIHRLGIPYANSQAAARFGGRSMRSLNSLRSGAAPAGVTGRFAGRTGGQAYRNASPPAQRFQNPGRQGYQPSQQYRAAPQVQRFQSQQRYQAQQQYRAAPQMPSGPRFGGSGFSRGGSFSGGGGFSRGGSFSGGGGGRHR